MNTAVRHLMWKEFRAVREFWLAMIALAVLGGWFVLSVWSNQTQATVFAYGMALAIPALFAVGCAGASFAMEREEGTVELLRAAPLSSPQIFTSKLSVAVLATVAMYLVLVPVTFLLANKRMPDPLVLKQLAGLWVLAAAEAIAWGLFFSLLLSRPLVAIILALLAGSSVAHMLAFASAQMLHPEFQLAPYSSALPWRALVTGILLAVDTYLGCRWLEGIDAPSLLERARAGKAWRRPEAVDVADSPALPQTVKAERSTIVARLFWQHFRQSWRLMLLVAAILLVVPIAVWMIILVHRSIDGLLILAIVPAIGGALVFLPDQERHRFRYFVEHNVPPRWVWFTRLLPWAVVIGLVTLALVWLWDGRNYSWQFITGTWDPNRFPGASYPFDSEVSGWFGWQTRVHSFAPPLSFVVAFVAMSFAAGQWASMHVKSGVLAGTLGVILGAIFCGWIWLATQMMLAWWLCVLPIPLVLIFATWLHAPDWIAENTTWPARARAAAAVGVPALALAGILPLYRVHQIPDVTPGFEVEHYLSGITPAARETGEIYMKASEAYQNVYMQQPEIRPTQRAYVAGNEEAIALMIEASKREECVLIDPRTADAPYQFKNGSLLLQLIHLSAELFEKDGKLDEALDRYFLECRVASHWSNKTLNGVRWWASVNGAISSLPGWAARSGQTSQRIRAAMARLSEITPESMHFLDPIQSNFVVARRFMQGDVSAFFVTWGPNLNRDLLWAKLMPWEPDRGMRLLDHVTRANLLRLSSLEHATTVGTGIIDWVHPRYPELYEYGRGFDNTLTFGNDWWNSDEVGWIMSTKPQLAHVAMQGPEIAQHFADFEIEMRSTQLLLALCAYRIDHGRLPDKLTDLVGDYLAEMPLDPLTGQPFRYYPEGLNMAVLPSSWYFVTGRPVPPGQPFIWSTSPLIRSAFTVHAPHMARVPDPEESLERSLVLRQPGRWHDAQSPENTNAALNLGFAFPIPQREE